jgi:hypothetical protein
MPETEFMSDEQRAGLVTRRDEITFLRIQRQQISANPKIAPLMRAWLTDAWIKVGAAAHEADILANLDFNHLKTTGALPAKPTLWKMVQKTSWGKSNGSRATDLILKINSGLLPKPPRVGLQALEEAKDKKPEKPNPARPAEKPTGRARQWFRRIFCH